MWSLVWLALMAALRAHPSGGHHLPSKYPCAFIDTVNITGSYPHYGPADAGNGSSNPSYIHEWMVIPHELVAVYDFVIENGVRLPTERHLRACVCKLKPCIRFCCKQGFYYDTHNQTCTRSAADEAVDQQVMRVQHANGSTSSVRTAAHFMVHIGAPCEQMRLLTKDHRVVHWTLFANGTIAHKKHFFTKHYCFTPLQDGSNSSWQWQPLACVLEKLPFVLGVREWTYAICLIITVICMFIIFFVYLLSVEMRNIFYGVAIKSYTLCIIIGYSLLAHLTLTDPANISKYACLNIPSFALLYLLLSFFILSVISVNFYLGFFGIILSKLMFWLIFLPVVLLVAGWSFFAGYDYYGNKPVFGNDTCWFDPRNLSIVVYLYTPIFVACTVCGVFYTLSLIRLSGRSTGRGDAANKPNASVVRNRFQSFWKFFGYTLIAWLVWMSSFAFNYYRGEKTHINYVVCLFVALHGFSAIYALIGKNQQIQNFLRRIDEDDDVDDIADLSVPMTNF